MDRLALAARDRLRGPPLVLRDGHRKGANGVSTDGVTVICVFFDGGTFWLPMLTYLVFPKVPGRTFFPNLSKFITFAAAPLVLTPFVRNQGDQALLHGSLGPGADRGQGPGVLRERPPD